jgi:mannose-6-phosphate isomerase-like protein (cupin superfamily)
MHDAPDTQALESAREYIAPDGSKVRPLCHIAHRGSFAHFRLEPGEVAKAVSHASVQEIWYVTGGTGQMWRRQEGHEPTVVDLRPGICLTIPLGTSFQFCADSPGEPLQVVAVTMPPWPDDGKNPDDGKDEARPEKGPWEPVLLH